MEGCPLGMADNEGLAEGWLLGCDDGFDAGRPDELGLSLGCDVGQSETEGCSEGWLLGAALMEGDSEGMDVGQPDIEGASLGMELGWSRYMPASQVTVSSYSIVTVAEVPLA